VIPLEAALRVLEAHKTDPPLRLAYIEVIRTLHVDFAPQVQSIVNHCQPLSTTAPKPA
jgi:hypothetical protein